jgi:hypothetical protein
MKITADMLRGAGACEQELALFAREWPRGATLSRKTLHRAVQLKLDVDWFIIEFFPGDVIDSCWTAADDAYEKGCQVELPAWDKYMSVRDAVITLADFVAEEMPSIGKTITLAVDDKRNSLLLQAENTYHDEVAPSLFVLRLALVNKLADMLEGGELKGKMLNPDKSQEKEEENQE